MRKRKEENNVQFNDIVESLTVKANDYLRSEDNKNKKDSALFWIFKFIILLFVLLIVNWFFNSIRSLGVELIYSIAKSLRSVLSLFWIVSLNFMKSMLIIYLLYDNLKLFKSSNYYKSLYQKDKKMKKNKEKLFKIIEIILKIYAIILMIAISFVALISLMGIIYFVLMLIDNIYVVSPFIICVSFFVISFFTFLHIYNKLFDKKQTITKNHFIIPFIILTVGVCFFGYELSSYEKVNSLPLGMDLTIKQETFKLDNNQKVYLNSDTKLNNIKIVEDNNLDGEIKIEFEYYKSANISYTYKFNNYNDLDLTFNSELNIDNTEFKDIFNLMYKTFSMKTIYNYNLFKYPNIYVFANKNDLNRITIK